MTREQWTIFGVLAALFGVELVINPATKTWLGNFGKSFGIVPLAQGETKQKISEAQIALPVMWLVGVAVIMVLADYAPRVALLFVALIAAGVILMHGDILAAQMNRLQGVLGQAPGQGQDTTGSEPTAPRGFSEPTAARG